MSRQHWRRFTTGAISMLPTFSLSRLAAVVFVLLLSIVGPGTASATVCVVADNGSGTAELPPASPTAGCTQGYLSPTDVHMIIDGLPPGTTIEFGAEHGQFLCAPNGVCSFAVPTPEGDCDQEPPGTPGEHECSDSTLMGQMTGTGALTGFNRTFNLPIEIETHVQPRTLGQPVQSFDTDMFRLFGQINMIGDPDFDLLRIVAGTDFGMPSPGHTTLTQLPGGNWNVDSYFDITYRIDFVGAPGGPLAGMSGSTTGTIRMQAGEPAVYDHLECFKMKDAIKLKGIVNLPSLAGTPYDAAGCRIGSAKKWCTPSKKQVLSSTPPAIAQPGPDLTSDYICYKISCPKVSLSQGVQDQFGPRALGKMKQGELCVPAVKTP